MSRLFVAVWPPDDVLARLADLPRRDEPGVRWTTPEQWHATLRFLGEAEPAVVEAALAGVDARAADASMGPRVSRLGRATIVVPVHGLDPLAAAVGTATADIGEPPDPRPFAGHVSLARLKNRGACGLTGTAIDTVFPVDEIALVESERLPDGARYRTLARFPLRRGRP